MSENSERSSWSSSFGFILACVGSAVGLGNIWKFPYITYENGGGAFVIIYLLAIALVGYPIMIAEIAIGKKAKANAYLAMGKLSKDNIFWKLVGGVTIITSFLILTYYSVVAGWTVEYCFQSLLGNLSMLNNETVAPRFTEFLGNGLKQVGYHTLFMFITTLIVIKEIKGIEKVLKVIMPLFVGLVILIAGYSLYEFGGGKTFDFLFSFDMEKITPHSVLEAVGHAFFTLSVSAGIMVIYGSHLTKATDIFKTGLWITLLDTMIAIIACFMMYPIIFGTDIKIGESVSILFTTLIPQFNSVPGGTVILSLFYLLVALAALSSTISILEVTVSFVSEKFNIARKKATLLSSGVIWGIGVLCALGLGANETLTKVDLFTKFDYLVSNWTMPVAGFLTSIFVGWYAADKYLKEDFEGSHHKMLYPIWKFSLRFIAPILVGGVIIYRLKIFS
ncbi:MAG: sodium-dependent transporter [Bacteriovoracaceae bacterium]|nr:sodium-dependent transporter [Bacteriovoracaceae bacterium]